MIVHQHLQDHLQRVSRSFSFCIEQLEEPLRRYVAVSYLLCRILDTVEDSAWPRLERQTEMFADFRRFLRGERAGRIEWSRLFPASLSEGERRLVADAPMVFDELSSFPEPVRGAVTEMIDNMACGMQVFALRRENGRLRLRSLLEVNQYCFFVAGIVGEVLARLVAIVEPKADLSQGTLLNAHHFGQFLQKVNLLKDQIGDEREGRFLVPDRSEIKTSLALNARGAFDYLIAQPVQLRGYRLFCAWSLFLGLATLSAAEQGFLKGRLAKVARSGTEQLLEQVARLLDRPDELRAQFETLLAQVQAPATVARTAHSGTAAAEPWVQRSYSGLLRGAELARLGVV
jgi:phytoene/squalene synthetase